MRPASLPTRVAQPWGRRVWELYLQVPISILVFLLLISDGFLLVAGLLVQGREMSSYGLRCSKPVLLNPNPDAFNNPCAEAVVGVPSFEEKTCAADWAQGPSEYTACPPTECSMEYGVSPSGKKVLRDLRIAALVFLWIVFALHLFLTVSTVVAEMTPIQLVVVLFNGLAAIFLSASGPHDLQGDFAAATCFLRFISCLTSVSFWWYYIIASWSALRAVPQPSFSPARHDLQQPLLAARSEPSPPPPPPPTQSVRKDHEAQPLCVDKDDRGYSKERPTFDNLSCQDFPKPLPKLGRCDEPPAPRTSTPSKSPAAVPPSWEPPSGIMVSHRSSSSCTSTVSVVLCRNEACGAPLKFVDAAPTDEVLTVRCSYCGTQHRVRNKRLASPSPSFRTSSPTSPVPAFRSHQLLPTVHTLPFDDGDSSSSGGETQSDWFEPPYTALVGTAPRPPIQGDKRRIPSHLLQ